MLQGYAFLQSALQQVMPIVRSTGLLSSTCTFYQPDELQDSAGAPSGTYVAVSNLSGIACTAPPYSEGNIAATESKSAEEVLSTRPLHVLLDAYYGDVVVTLPSGQTVSGPQTNFRLSIDGTQYDILGVEHDSQKQMTRVYVRTGTL